MAFRILKNIVKATVLLSVGAGVGIWFAPPNAKSVMKQRLGIVQKHTSKIQSSADKLWSTTLEKKFVKAGKSLDPRNIDRKTIDGWVSSGKQAVSTISMSAKKTQANIIRANQIIQSAKTEYRQFGTIFGM